MKHASPIVVAVLGFALPSTLCAVACSSFTTSTLAPDGGVALDATTADVGTVSTLDAASDATVDPAYLIAQLDPSRVRDCGNWSETSAKFDRASATPTQPEGGCSLCPTSDTGGGSVSLALPPVTGTYTISLDVVSNDPEPTQASAGFQLDGANAGTDTSEVDGTQRTLSKSVPVRAGATSFAATIAADATGGRCVVVSSITIAYTP